MGETVDVGDAAMEKKQQHVDPTRKRGKNSRISFTYTIVLNAARESTVVERSPEQRWDEIVKVCSNIVAGAQPTKK